MTNSHAPYFYAVAVIVVGWVIGFLDSNTASAKKIEAAEANAEMKIKEAEKKIAQAEQNSPASSNLQDDPGLLRLKKNNGRFTLEMDGDACHGRVISR